MSGWGTFCGDKGTQGLWPGPDQVRGAGPTDSLFQSSGLSVPQIPSSSPLQGGRLQGGTASRPAPSSGTRQPPWVWFWKGLGGATRGLSGLSCQPPKGGRSQPGGWRATPLRGWPCFRLPALAASLHPGAGGGQGALLQGALPLEKPPVVVYQGLAAFGVGRRVPRHRAQALGWPWRWRPGCPCGLLARGGPLTPSPVASGSPSPGLGDGGGGGPGRGTRETVLVTGVPGSPAGAQSPARTPGRPNPPEARALGLWHLGGA